MSFKFRAFRAKNFSYVVDAYMLDGFSIRFKVDSGDCHIDKIGLFWSDIHKELVLLGTDFMDACSFTKERNSSMFFHTVDENLALENFEILAEAASKAGINMISTDEYIDSLKFDVNTKFSKERTAK